MILQTFAFVELILNIFQKKCLVLFEVPGMVLLSKYLVFADFLINLRIKIQLWNIFQKWELKNSCNKI